MKVLELFSGSQSIGKVCKELGYEVISVDICDYEGKYKPTHLINIMDFDYKQYTQFDIIWASPPCINYTFLQHGWYGKHKKDGLFTKEKHFKLMDESDILVKKTLEIIDYFKPNLWFIENPATGYLLKRNVMKDIPFYKVTYCKYSDWGYMKPTIIWTNKKNFNPKYCKKDCPSIIPETRKHKVSVALISNKKDMSLYRGKIPPNLIKDLII